MNSLVKFEGYKLIIYYTMDIAKFNKELGYKVAKATGLENNNKIKEAIEEWVSISEMVIKASKTPNLEFSYKSMLIDKTKQIIDHIKGLKIKLIEEKKIDAIKSYSESQEYIHIQSNESVNQIESKLENLEEINDKKPVEFVEKSEFKNLPKGFKEIKAEKDFEIVTPHDKDYIKKIISKNHTNMHNRGENQTSPDQKKIICFACGVELPYGTKLCPQCGTQLKK